MVFHSKSEPLQFTRTVGIVPDENMEFFGLDSPYLIAVRTFEVSIKGDHFLVYVELGLFRIEQGIILFVFHSRLWLVEHLIDRLLILQPLHHAYFITQSGQK
jgi:hypothetical protein